MSPPRGHWDMIPNGRNSVCLHEPAGEPPTILYREELQPAQVDVALTKAWKVCNLPGVAQACSYTVDLHKPQFECTKDADCETRGPGYFCDLDTHTAECLEHIRSVLEIRRRTPKRASMPASALSRPSPTRSSRSA
jgi:hypothetical protein